MDERELNRCWEVYSGACGIYCADCTDPTGCAERFGRNYTAYQPHIGVSLPIPPEIWNKMPESLRENINAARKRLEWDIGYIMYHPVETIDDAGGEQKGKWGMKISCGEYGAVTIHLGVSSDTYDVKTGSCLMTCQGL
jgi:hypothetical protein